MLHARRTCHCRNIGPAARVRLVVRAQQQGRPPSIPRSPVPPPPRPPSGYPSEQRPTYQYGEPGAQPGGPGSQHFAPGDASAATPSLRNSAANGSSMGLGGYAQALVAAAFVMGLGIGTWFDSEVVLTPANVSSTEIIDRAVPNADICMANGYSASVLSMNVFVTYNPFNVYISQPQVKGGCVLRRANVGLLEREKLVTPHDVDLCKQRMNTFAYVGDLKSEPEVECVYHSEEAENQYLEVLGNRAKMSQLLMQQPTEPLAENQT
ncbi:hypothetical protein VOLCADRAFT_79371 [Volvox carteri f. nagariensis]|uniref:DUF3172 domain-containing protein n=1 Tax=Volvox carteri f. nagariensis TaxID=3068 RepID=D8TK59_VOLCA|nr:uncharacterized protein VOLCADRAFT_79371 [Volvox carteri f. nagariensis]EFJ52004.1 hypothetical protein VOLCADRAFT_79371 [Volvox carteri f. nagariensis]|eukprot:XP_002946778.1 hypothetical protein VOLCADRAFT_79371 [Volvox carteri f. nagariensis]